MAIGRSERATSLDSVHINSDVVFGLVHLLGMQYRPAPADIPDQKGWCIQNADYGSLSRFARGKIDLEKCSSAAASTCASNPDCCPASTWPVTTPAPK
jgi:TnpA family transposase